MEVNYYTIYRKENDEIVAQGTARRCAEIMGMNLDTFYSIVSKSRKGKRETYEILIEPFIEILKEEKEYGCK